ncbi:MAG: primosomal protein N', partial [Rothia sp. (in: high G+C Gram-positive bacteria)]|nr:primosomal protein N' [Rothia sp. (in: high G+C Gram-positive bacteria)]
AAGAAARAVLSVLPSHPEYSWEHLLAISLVQVAATGRGALGIVPDLKSLDRLEAALLDLVPESSYVRLTANDKPTSRYTNFLRAKNGEVSIVIGTRSAAYAPVQNLGFVACWDDGDSSLVEQHGPYCHARDVLLLRATLTGSAALFMGYAISSEAARLVRSRWASLLTADRPLVRSFTPRIMPTGDDYQLARDPLAALARIPHQAFVVAQDALKSGPVLVQVARAGYIPALACQSCRMPARCDTCRGPLSLPHGQGQAQCGWCGKIVSNWHCNECGAQRWRSGAVGALRTAEELGRAFPGVPVISSSGENIKTVIGPEPALVVATPGGEPVAEGGYAAALLLDADRMVQSDSLRAPEAALRRWFNAAALVRSFAVGGRVVTTASPSATLEALVRWDPMGYALWEMEERQEIGLPPAVRTVAITGSMSGVEAFLAALEIPEDVRVSGPVPLDDASGFYEGEADEQLYRAILFFSYARGHQFTRHIRAIKASLSALKKSDQVQVRCDGLDIL